MFHVPNQYRVRSGPYASDYTDGNNGAFFLPAKFSNRYIVILASDGMGWEHVSVSIQIGNTKVRKSRTPNWDEMAFVKDLLWDEQDVVVQFHPAKSEYINMHENVLHLWRPIGVQLPFPPSILVGLKGVKFNTESQKLEEVGVA